MNAYKYLAFISYKREDEAWAKWLQYKLEHYKLPTNVRRDNPSLPKTARPVFKDTTDLSGGVLEEAIKSALASSQYLIVVCSPRAAQSPWVCKEVQEFIDSGREKNIIPFIIDGEPFSTDIAKECFPQNLRSLSNERELLGINVNEMGRDAAAIKVVARMFNLQFDLLWQRWERERRVRRRMIVSFSLLGVVVALTIAGVMFYQHRKMQVNQARAVAHRAKQLVDQGDSYLALKLLLEVLPDENHFLSRPYVAEAEEAFRYAESHRNVKLMTPKVANSALFTPDSKSIISTAGGDILVWSIHTGECLKTINVPGEDSYIYDIAISGDGKRLASAMADGSILIWDTSTWQCIETLSGHSRCIRCVRFSFDNRYVVSCYADGQVKVWSAASWDCIKMLKGFTNEAMSLDISPDGKYIASGSTEGVICVWGGDAWDSVRTINMGKSIVTSLSFSKDGTRLASSELNAGVRIWNIDTCTCTTHLFDDEDDHLQGVTCVNFSNDGKFLVTSSQRGSVKVWNVKSGQCVRTQSDYTGYVYCVNFSRDGKYLVSTSDDTTIQLWGVDNSNSVKELQFANREECKITPDGRYVVVSEKCGLVTIWDGEKMEWVKKSDDCPWERLLSSQINRRHNLGSFSCDGKHELCIKNDVVKVLDVESQTCVGQLVGHTDRVDIAKYSPNGKYIVTVSNRCCDLKVWDSESFTCVFTIAVGYVDDVALSGDGCYLAIAGCQVVEVLDITTSSFVSSSRVYNDNMCSVCFSPDGLYVVSSTRRGEVDVIDAESGKSIWTYEGDNTGYADYLDHYVSFTADGRHIVSASSFNGIKVWEFKPLRELMDETRERFKNFSLSEYDRQEYYLE